MVRKGGVYLLSDGECWLGMAEAGVPMTRAHSTLAVALAVALAEGKPLKPAIHFASAAGALATTAVGAAAAAPGRDAVEGLIAGEISPQ